MYNQKTDRGPKVFVALLVFINVVILIFVAIKLLELFKI